MACFTRCVSSWETNRCEDRPFAVFPIHDLNPLERTREETQNPRKQTYTPCRDKNHMSSISARSSSFVSAQPLLETTQKLVLFALGKR